MSEMSPTSNRENQKIPDSTASSSKKNKNNRSNQQIVFQFAGLASQFLAGIGISVFIGLKADQWLQWKLPIWVWVLPLLFIILMIIWIIQKAKS
ncbi:MAG: hypothetical protein ACO29O_09000 [Chitinophagaceae bacterium]